MPGKPAAIRTVGLTKVFGKRTVVDNLSFEVKEGELYALLGDNGAGKTTTISMLTTLLTPTRGTFFIAGVDGLKESEKVKSSYGIVSQDVALYNELTAFENLKFVADMYGMPKKEAVERVNYLLADCRLADRANDLVGGFSGGMQRKLAIACALVHNPRVVFMDEPTVGLDPAARRHIWSTLKNLRDSGVTILLTTHYLEEAELLADRIGIIRQGKLAAEGTIDELRKQIRGMRTISMRLAGQQNYENLIGEVQALLARYQVQVQYDRLRNTMSFSQPKDADVIPCLKTVLDWLDKRNMPFSKLATGEPNLEEVFLAIAVDSEEEQVINLSGTEQDEEAAAS